MTEPINPAQVEQTIRQVADAIARSVRVCSDLYIAFLDADREYDHAYAEAYLHTHGPAHEKRYRAELETTEERATRDRAEAEFKYADRRAKALESELRAYQSVGASVRAMYAVAGIGEP